VVRADGPEGLRGAVVLRGPEGPEQQGTIVDLIADSGDTPTIDALIAHAREDFAARQASVIRVFATSDRIRSRLRRAGFLDTHHTPRFSYFVATPLPFDPNAVEWSFFHGDGDCELYA
jgi:hypothetical protein